MVSLRIQLLGPPTLFNNGQIVQISRKKSLGLLAYLSDTRRVVTREETAELFWPGHPASKALSSLRTVIAELKSVLGPENLKTSDNTILLLKDNITCDLALFRKGFIDSKYIEEYRITADLWKGGFMAGFHLKNCTQFSDWQFLEEQNLLRDYENLLCKLSEELSQCGRYKEAVNAARECLKIDPYDEKIHRHIMYIYAKSGDKKAAVSQFSHCREIIKNELDLPLETETLALCERIRTGEFDNQSSLNYINKHKTTNSVPRVAVLPFIFLNTPSKEDLSLIDICAEAATDILARAAEVEAISGTSTLSYRNTDKNLSKIASELRADFIVEGVLNKSAEGVRIEGRLINTSRDSVIAVKEQKINEDVNVMYSAVETILKYLIRQISTAKPDNTNVLVKTSLTNGHAEVIDQNIAIKMMAKHLNRHHDEKAYDQALELYRKAVSINRNDAEAWAGIANTLIIRSFEGMYGADVNTVYKEAETAATTSLSINPLEPTALGIRGIIASERDWDYESAELYYKKSLEVLPDNPEVLENYSILLLMRNRIDEAVFTAERACELDPINRFTLGTKFWTYVAIKKYRKAMEVQEQTYMFFPNQAWDIYKEGYFHILLGNIKKAITCIESVKKDLIALNRSTVLGMLAYAYALDGRNQEAQELLDEICIGKKTYYGYHIPVAAAYLGMGKINKSLEWIRAALKSRDPGLFFLIATPFFEPLYSNPQFIGLLEQANIVPRD